MRKELKPQALVLDQPTLLIMTERSIVAMHCLIKVGTCRSTPGIRRSNFLLSWLACLTLTLRLKLF